MISDINVFGLFLNAGLVTAVAAALVMWPLRRLLVFARVYRWVWHPALVDLCIFLILWGALAAGLRADLLAFFPFLLG